MASTDKFKTWIKIKSAQIMGIMKTQEELEKEIDEAMEEKNLKIEYL